MWPSFHVGWLLTPTLETEVFVRMPSLKIRGQHFNLKTFRDLHGEVPNAVYLHRCCRVVFMADRAWECEKMLHKHYYYIINLDTSTQSRKK